MSGSSDDSDCFESADEGIEDDDNKSRETSKSDENNSRPSNEHSSPKSGDLIAGNGSDAIGESDAFKSSKEYRKRPERGKALPKKIVPPSNSPRKISLNDQIFNADLMKPDVLIQDITSNLSKNLNKGFNTIQQTSSSIKDLVLSSLPTATQKASSGAFSYDDDDDYDNNDKDVEIASGIADDEVNESNKFDTCESEKFQKDVFMLKEGLANICAQIQNTQIIDTLISKNEENEENPLLKNQEIEFSTEKENTAKLLKSNIPDKQQLDENIHEKVGVEEIHEHELHSENNHEEKSIEAGEEILDKKMNENEAFDEVSDNKASDNDEGNNKIDNSFSEIDNNFEPSCKIKPQNEDNSVEGIHESKDGWDSTELDLDEIEVQPHVECASNTHETEPVNNSAVKNETVEAENTTEDNEGWDDFDFDEDAIDNLVKNENKVDKVASAQSHNTEHFKSSKSEGAEGGLSQSNDSDFKWSGWDHFGEKQESKKKTGWTLGSWPVNALLNTATSVTQGISSVLEAGLGAPDPLELARMERQQMRDQESRNNKDLDREIENQTSLDQAKTETSSRAVDNSGLGLDIFGITNLVADVTNKFVENSVVQEIGSRVLSGGLETLETVGKKTMEVLQEGDPGWKRKRALFLGSDKPVLSQVLREAKMKAEMVDKKLEEKQMAKMCHFETLFDDFQGLIHLEALEMLSRQCELKLDQMKSSLPVKEVDDLIGIIEEVKELCIIDEDEFKSNYSMMIDFKSSLGKAVEPLQNEISIDKIIQVYEAQDGWFKSEGKLNPASQNIFQKAISTMAELTASTVQQFHKGGELLAIKEHRKTVEEADALLQMTGLMCNEIGLISEKFLNLHKSSESHSKFEHDRITKTIQEEAQNARSYIKDAFNLLIPVLQLGAAT